MKNHTETLTTAYTMVQAAGLPYSPEINTILCMFISPEQIRLFENDTLYLKFLENLIKQRENVSFPEKEEEFQHYFQDCLLLKRQMQNGHSDFPEADYLSYTLRLLENLKTPYYTTFSQVLLCLERCFRNRAVLEKTLKGFYSILIKSSEKNRRYMEIIAVQTDIYKQYSFFTEELISDLLLHYFSVFSDEKEFWIKKYGGILPSDYFKLEETYLKQYTPSDRPLCISSYLSGLSFWLSDITKEKADSSVLAASRPLITDSSFLNTYAYNMTARAYLTNPAIGREEEISDLELILLSPKKSPILIGEAGVGKTSIVEGLSWLLQQGNVPELLKNRKIFKLTTTSLLSGTKYVGEMEERMQSLMKELEKYPEVILFIDEIHTIVGAGSTESSNNDISNMLKPFIDRGDVKIIGATTKQEYLDYILPDKALSRRFYPVSVDEPNPSVTLDILKGTIPAIEQQTGVSNPFSEATTDEFLKQLILLSSADNQPKDRLTRRPELPLTLLEMAFSHAALRSAKELSFDDIISSVRHTNLLKKEIKQNAPSFFGEKGDKSADIFPF